jgi:hypothetical protein
MSGFVGWIRTRFTWFFVSKKATFVHVFAPSFVIQTPSPGAALPRMSLSPPPDHTISGFDSLTASAPIVPPKYLSVTGLQLCPPSVVLNTPPPVVPM